MLSKQRERIDTLDQQIVGLLEERLKVVEEVVNIKIQHDLPILDQAREDALIEKVVSLLKNKDLETEMRSFYQELMQISRRYQDKIKAEYEREEESNRNEKYGNKR